MNRTVVVALLVLSALSVGLKLLASADELAGGELAERPPLATICASPDRYAGKAVVIQGVVAEMTRAIFPNGRPYYTLSISDGQTAITVFSWDRPSVEQGDLVQVVGVLYPWRYNLRHVIESRRIIRSTLRASAPEEQGVTIPGTRKCGEPA